MKKYSWILCCAIFAISLIFILPTRAQAAEIIDSGTCGPSVTWTLDSDGTLTISGTGEVYNYLDYNEEDWTKDRPWESELDRITAVVIEEGVAGIGDRAFAWCSNLVSVTIPKSLCLSGQGAYLGCNSLTEVYISDVRSWVSIYSYSSGSPLEAGEKEKKLYLNGQLVIDLVIPEGAQEIGRSAFCGCSSIRSITIPKSLKTIEEYAFLDCENLTDIYVPGIREWLSIEHVGFNYTMNLLFANDLDKKLYLNGQLVTDLVIPEGFTDIPDGSFGRCTGITSVTIPEGVTNIGDRAFQNCKNLKSVTFPKSLTYIEEWAFSGCDSLTELYIDDVAAWAAVAFDTNASPLRVNNLEKKFYLKGRLVTDLVIPEGVTSIPERAFTNCSIKSVTLPEGLTDIGIGAFIGCKNLVRVVVPKSLKTIGNLAFSGCDSLAEVHVEDIGAWASITFGDDEDNISHGANPLKANNRSKKLYLKGQLVTKLVIPEGTTAISPGAFEHCSSITAVVLPASVKRVGGLAFSSCSSLWHILYRGTQVQWEEIDIRIYAYDESVVVHYNCTGNEIKACTKETCTLKGLAECSVCNDILWESKPDGEHDFVNHQCTKCGEKEENVKPEEELAQKGLSSLAADGYSLMPAFDPKVTRYEILLPYEIQSIRIQATAADSKTTVTVEGGDDLVAGADNEIKVVCIAEDGSYKVYLVIAKRASADGEYPESTEPSTEPEQEQPTEPSAPDTQQPAEGTDDPGETEAEQTQPGTDPVQPDEGGKNDGVVSWVFLPLVGGGCLGIGIVISKLPLLKKKR